jgi:hypothetical protein
VPYDIQFKKEEKMKTILLKTSVVVLILFLVTLCNGCKEKDDPAQNVPEIVGCNSVNYQGQTFSNLGCAPGISSFDIDISQNGHSASFHITCSGGCVSTVTLR